MTKPTIVTTGGASEHTVRYEALRDHALCPHPTPAVRDGLAVLLRQGVAAWTEAWSRVPAPATRAAPEERNGPSLPASASAAVVRVLAAMALGHLEEMHA
jgi:hypothetical protein